MVNFASTSCRRWQVPVFCQIADRYLLRLGRHFRRYEMIVYVAFGGMLATTWVQIVKAVLMLRRGRNDPRHVTGAGEIQPR